MAYQKALGKTRKLAVGDSDKHGYFRQEIKDEIKGTKKTVTEIEKSLEEVSSHTDDTKKQLKAQKEIKECH